MGSRRAMVVKRAGFAVLASVAVWASLCSEAQAENEESSAAGESTELNKGAPTQRVNLMVQDRGVTQPPSKEPTLDSAQIGLGAGFFMEDSEQRDEQLRGGQETRNTEPQEWESASVYNLQAWYLRAILTPGLRWGGGITWYNSYSLEDPEAENDDEEPFVVGQLFQVGLQGEYEITRVVSDLGVVLGLRGGGSMLFPSKDLRARLEALDRLGFDTWGGPSPGVYLAPLAGIRWPLTERVSLRADLSVQFSKLWLYSADGEAAGITSEENSELATTRTQLLIGLDFGL
jgi:hypothetical protein